MRVLKRLLVLLGLLIPLHVVSALSQEAFNLAPGDQITLDDADAPHDFAIKTESIKGAVAVAAAQKDGKSILRLVYTAPSTKEPLTDTLGYTRHDGSARTASIAIAPRPSTPTIGTATYEAGFKALFVLFVLAVLLESALALVFNWRPFIENLNARAVRPLVSFGVAFAFVTLYDLDIVTTLVNIFAGRNEPSSSLGFILTAMVLAGGSAGVNTILVTLGYRQQRTPESAAAKPPPDKAWISVAVERKNARKPIEVYIGTPLEPTVLGGVAVADWAALPLVGVISGSSRPGFRYFFADRGRFPTYGGHAVAKDTLIAVELRSEGPSNETIKTRWGPNVVAAGGIIDLKLEL